MHCLRVPPHRLPWLLLGAHLLTLAPAPAVSTPVAASQAISVPDNSIAGIIDRYADEIMGLPDVVGIAESLCDAQPCIRILLRRDNTETRARLPVVLEGVPVVVEVSGPVQANPQP